MAAADMAGGGVPAPLAGFLRKKNPKFPIFQQRYVVVRNSRLEWYGSEEEFRTQGHDFKDGSLARGFVNLTATKCVLEPEGDSRFSLAPESIWADETTTSRRFTGGASRVFHFDAAGSTFHRAIWIEAIRQHMELPRPTPAPVRASVHFAASTHLSASALASHSPHHDNGTVAAPSSHRMSVMSATGSDGFESCRSQPESAHSDEDCNADEVNAWMTNHGFVSEELHQLRIQRLRGGAGHLDGENNTQMLRQASGNAEQQKWSAVLATFEGGFEAAFEKMPHRTARWPDLCFTRVPVLLRDCVQVSDVEDFMPEGSVMDMGLLFIKLFGVRSEFTMLLHELSGHHDVQWTPPVPLEGASWGAFSTLECQVKLPALGWKTYREVQRFALCRDRGSLVLAIQTYGTIFAGNYGSLRIFRYELLSTFEQQKHRGPVRMRAVGLSHGQETFPDKCVVDGYKVATDIFCSAARQLPRSFCQSSPQQSRQ